MDNKERLTKYVTPVGMCMTSLNSMKHYMPCVPCRHKAELKTDSKGKQYTEKFSFCDTCEVKMLFNRLKEYEDLEEQGLLLKLPCKRVWCIVDAKTKYAYVLGKAIDNLTISEIRGIDKKGYYYSTAEKAEKALADMRKKVQE